MTDRKVSRRGFVAAGPLAAGLILAPRGSAAQSPSGAPDVQLLYTPNFDNEEVLRFVADEMETAFKGPDPTLPNYSLAGQPKRAGAQPDIKLTAAKILTYRVSKNRTLIGTFDVTVPVTEHVTMTVFSRLLIRDGVNDEVKLRMVAAFDTYDFATAPDAIAYAQQHMTADGVTADMFAVRQSFELAKEPGRRQENREQRNAILSLYGADISPDLPPKNSKGEGGGNLDMIGNEAPLAQQLSQDGYTVALIHTTAVGQLPTQPHDSLHERVGLGSSAPPVGQIIQEETKGLECQIDPNDTLNQRIATVFAYPEFMLTWEPFPIRLGCVTIVLTLPVLWIRFSAIVLWAYVGKPLRIPAMFIRLLQGCVIKAIVSGAIIGIVLANFAAALAAFRVVFVECVTDIPEKIAMCLIPGLVLLTEPDGDWRHAV